MIKCLVEILMTVVKQPRIKHSNENFNSEHARYWWKEIYDRSRRKAGIPKVKLKKSCPYHQKQIEGKFLTKFSIKFPVSRNFLHSYRWLRVSSPVKMWFPHSFPRIFHCNAKRFKTIFFLNMASWIWTQNCLFSNTGFELIFVVNDNKVLFNMRQKFIHNQIDWIQYVVQSRLVMLTIFATIKFPDKNWFCFSYDYSKNQYVVTDGWSLSRHEFWKTYMQTWSSCRDDSLVLWVQFWIKVKILDANRDKHNEPCWSCSLTEKKRQIIGPVDSCCCNFYELDKFKFLMASSLSDSRIKYLK